MNDTMKPHILIVDDEPDILSTLERLVKSEGFDVVTAGNGKEALNLFQKVRVDLVISDVRMPEMDGIELMRQVKKIDKDIEFIILTGFASVENAVDAMREGGASDYLTKPLDNPDILIHTINNVLERQALRQQNKKLVEKLLRKNSELETALKEIKTLKGFVPICSSCKKIRDDKGYWNQLEAYLEKHSDASFSHSMCPECNDKFYGDEEWYQKMKKDNNI